MSGKPSVWTAERQVWLIDAVRTHILAAGRVDWKRIAHSGSVTVHGARMQYQELNRKGRAPLIRTLLKEAVDGKLDGKQTTSPNAEPEQKVETKTTESGVESTAVGQHIRTVEDLLRHIGADLTRYEIDKFEATKWDGHSKDQEGKAKVTELHRVWVRLKPKAGPSTQEVVGTIIDAAFAVRRPMVRRPSLPKANDDLLAVMVAPEPHVGKGANNSTTGHGDYGIATACGLFRDAASDLLQKSSHIIPARRLIGILGDYFHADSMGGTTTKGTPVGIAPVPMTGRWRLPDLPAVAVLFVPRHLFRGRRGPARGVAHPEAGLAFIRQRGNQDVGVQGPALLDLLRLGHAAPGQQ